MQSKIRVNIDMFRDKIWTSKDGIVIELEQVVENWCLVNLTRVPILIFDYPKNGATDLTYWLDFVSADDAARFQQQWMVPHIA